MPTRSELQASILRKRHGAKLGPWASHEKRPHGEGKGESISAHRCRRRPEASSPPCGAARWHDPGHFAVRVAAGDYAWALRQQNRARLCVCGSMWRTSLRTRFCTLELSHVHLPLTERQSRRWDEVKSKTPRTATEG